MEEKEITLKEQVLYKIRVEFSYIILGNNWIFAYVHIVLYVTIDRSGS